MIYVVIAFSVFVMLWSVYIPVPWAIRNIVRKRFWEKIGKSDCVCLTFDDGPNPSATPRIQALLDEAGAKGTFFVTGENVEKHPDIVKNLTEKGHEVGEHSFLHSHPWKTGPLRSWRDIRNGGRALEKTFGSQEPFLLRPPFGKLNLMTLSYVVFLRKRLAFWNIDPRDYELSSVNAVVQYVMDRVVPGCVILLHDGRDGRPGDASVTVSAVESLLAELNKRQMRLTTVSEALGNS